MVQPTSEESDKVLDGTPLPMLAKTIRSKNAGVDTITFDIIFADRDNYQRVKNSRVITREGMLELFQIGDERMPVFLELDHVLAIKFSIYRDTPSGSPGDADPMGAQQYGPLLDIVIPEATADTA